jgi:predicted nuclease with TOPRIM domain
MAEENELQRLEEFVSTLLKKFNDLQDQNKELMERMQRREATIETLQEDLASMKDERGDISTRVSNLIGKIEEWESSTDDESDEESVSDAADETSNDSGVQGNLFAADA